MEKLEKIDKIMNGLIDEYFEDGIFLKEEEKLLFIKAREIDYPLDKLKLLIEKRKAEEEIKLQKKEEAKIQKQKEEANKLKLKEEAVRLKQMEEADKKSKKDEALRLKLEKEKEINQKKKTKEKNAVREKKQIEAVARFDSEGIGLWIFILVILGLMVGVIHCILQDRGFFAYILIPILAGIVSPFLTSIIKIIVHNSPVRYHFLLKAAVLLLYLILAYVFCRGFSDTLGDLSSLWIWIKSIF